MNSEEQKVMLTKSDVAKRLKVSTRTINRLMQKKELPYHKVGTSVRFTLADIEEYLTKQKNN